MGEKIILDCDPGVDDALAIMMAIASDDIDLLGITTVTGNVSLEHTSRNALDLVAFCGHPEIPVYKGCAVAILADGARHATVHGSNGLGNVELPRSSAEFADGHAVDYIIKTVREAAPSTINLVAVGPLTNVALAFLLAPDLAQRLKKLIIMGGTKYPPGNMTPMAEFNFWVDPHAAEIVMKSGAKIEIMGLNLTHQARASDSWLDQTYEEGGHITRTMVDILRAYTHFDGSLHDPCTIARLIDPTLFAGAEYQVSVDHREGATFGQMIVSSLELEDDTPRPEICVWEKLNGDAMLAQIRALLLSLDAR